MERPRKGQPEGMRRHGERKERPRGGVSGLRGRRRVRHAPGPAVHASPPGSRDTVGLCCRGRLRGPGSGTRGVGRRVRGKWIFGRKERGGPRGARSGVGSLTRGGRGKEERGVSLRGRGGRKWQSKAELKKSPSRHAGEGYCRSRPSTSLGSGPGSPAAAAASSCSSTNLFSSNSSMSTRRKREDSVFRAMAGAWRPLSRLSSWPDLRSTRLGTGSGAGSGSPALPPPPPRVAAAAARPLPAHTGTGSTGGRGAGPRGGETGSALQAVLYFPRPSPARVSSLLAQHFERHYCARSSASLRHSTNP